MVVPTLPVFGVTPPFMLFYILTWLVVAFVLVLHAAAIVSTFVLILLIPYWMLRRRIPRQRGPRGCCGCMKTVFLCVGRWLCVHTFPALFKMHKTRSGHGSQMRSFMVFLDRKVESSLTLVAAFCCMVYSVCYSSTIVFIQYFPVERSEECLEKDSHSRPLFCYSRSSNSSLPVDCAEYNVTELRELQFACFTIAIPGHGLGIAIAAALGLAKVTIVSITIFVKITEGYFKMTKKFKPSRKLPWWCCLGSRKCANGIYVVSSLLLLTIIVPLVSTCLSLSLVIANTITDVDLTPLYDSDYMFFPVLVCFPLSYVIVYLKDHCDKGEYASFAADQRPLDPRDWDVESGSSVTAGQQDEAGTGGASGGTNGVALNETCRGVSAH